MSLYESIAARLIGTPLQRPAEWLRAKRGEKYRRAHPELAEWFSEGERTDRYLQGVVRADTNCIDIGCHIGSFLQKIRTMAPRGRHWAVEPVPFKADWLKKKFPDVTVLDVALGESSGTTEFHVNEQQTSYSGTKTRSVPGAIRTLQVRLRRLDEEIPADARIGFVKIDVNGAELMALRGAERLLQRDRPAILLECTKGGLDDYGIDAGDVYAFLTGNAGYRILLLKDFPAGGPPLDVDGFRRSMEYPFQAFNFAVLPAERLAQEGSQR